MLTGQMHGVEEMEATKRMTERLGQSAKLFIIKVRNRDLFWNCSPEHGSGWHPHYPKQAWSKSELAKELFRMIDNSFFQDCEILELEYRQLSSGP